MEKKVRTQWKSKFIKLNKEYEVLNRKLNHLQASTDSCIELARERAKVAIKDKELAKLENKVLEGSKETLRLRNVVLNSDNDKLILSNKTIERNYINDVARIKKRNGQLEATLALDSHWWFKIIIKVMSWVRAKAIHARSLFGVREGS